MKENNLASFYRPPAWSTGHIDFDDAVFLDRMLRESNATEAIEVGVASGSSSAVLLRALDAMGGHRCLHSFDIAELCYFNPKYKVGAAVDELAPQLKHLWRLNTGKVALDAGRQLACRAIRFAFVDGDHRHPWAAFDLLALLPALDLRAHVVFHDIVLPNFSKWKVYGPLHMFEGWKGKKHAEAVGRGNIGLIELPGDHAIVRQWVTEILAKPWEVDIEESLLDAVGVTRDGCTGRTVLHGVKMPWPAALEDAVAQGRPVLIWGAGLAGRACIKALRARDVSPAAIIDSDPKKAGHEIDGCKVCAPDSIDRMSPRPFILIASMFAGEIEATLHNRFFVGGADFTRFTSSES